MADTGCKAQCAGKVRERESKRAAPWPQARTFSFFHFNTFRRPPLPRLSATHSLSTVLFYSTLRDLLILCQAHSGDVGPGRRNRGHVSTGRAALDRPTDSLDGARLARLG